MKRKILEVDDITGDIGPLVQRNELSNYPMYSFSRAAHCVWQGVYAGLIEQGKSKEQAIAILQSKHMRWALDGSFSDALEQAGKDYALKHGKDWKL